MLEKVRLIYDFKEILNADYNQHLGSCIKHQVHELTDVHDKFGGFPQSYVFENTQIHQLWWNEDQLDFNDIGDQLGIEVITISSIKQPPGCTIPWHRDTFYQITKKYPERNDLKVRANIFLEESKIGHFIQYEINDKLYSATEWEVGDGYLWDSNHLHLGANAGMVPKYTLQISGFLKK